MYISSSIYYQVGSESSMLEGYGTKGKWYFGRELDTEICQVDGQDMRISSIILISANDPVSALYEQMGNAAHPTHL